MCNPIFLDQSVRSLLYRASHLASLSHSSIVHDKFRDFHVDICMPDMFFYIKRLYSGLKIVSILIDNSDDEFFEINLSVKLYHGESKV